MKLPNIMKAVQGKGYGNINEMLSVEDNVPVPTLDDDDYNAFFVEPLHPLIKYATYAKTAGSKIKV